MHRYLLGLCAALCAVVLAVFAWAPPVAAAGGAQAAGAGAVAAASTVDPTTLLAALLAGGGVLCFGLGLRARAVRAQTESRLEAFVVPSLGVSRRARRGHSLVN